MLNILERFQRYHLTIQSVLVQAVSSCTDELLSKVVKEYEQQYGVEFETICSFPKDSIIAIQGSRVHENLRGLIGKQCGDSIHILFHDRVSDVMIELHRRSIAEIATCHQPTSTVARLRYQHHFGCLVCAVFDKFLAANVITEDTVCLAPLRAGTFVAGVGLDIAENTIKVSYVHSKRVYFGSDSVALAISRLEISEFLGKRQLVICDGGLVSGITVVGLMETLAALDVLPEHVTICVVHAAMYGIMNVLRAACRLNVMTDVWAGITSFAIGKSLYAFYDFPDWKTGTLVTGDIGDYLEPVESES